MKGGTETKAGEGAENMGVQSGNNVEKMKWVAVLKGVKKCRLQGRRRDEDARESDFEVSGAKQ